MSIALSDESAPSPTQTPSARPTYDPAELSAAWSVKVTGLAQKLGQLEAVHRDFQSKYWANLKFLGQPCNFYAWARPCSLYRPVVSLGQAKRFYCFLGLIYC
jgi:hypothetical protein